MQIKLTMRNPGGDPKVSSGNQGKAKTRHSKSSGLIHPSSDVYSSWCISSATKDNNELIYIIHVVLVTIQQHKLLLFFMWKKPKNHTLAMQIVV